MRYLIVGGAGFIGINLVEYRVNKGDEVVLCENHLHTGTLENRSNVKELNSKLGTDIKSECVENTITGYVGETLADTQKVEEVLGFKANVSLSQGIDKLLG